jgi:FkbM family methyltransferase
MFSRDSRDARLGGIRDAARQMLRKAGFDLIRYPAGTSFGAALKKVIDRVRPDLLVDVGPYRGSFADVMRSLGYAGRIISLEPNLGEAGGLRKRAKGDPLWTVHQPAAGDVAAKRLLRVSPHGNLSSLLAPTERGLEYHPPLRESADVPVDVVRLDRFLPNMGGADAERIFIKTDTQGSDLNVLVGATGILDRVVTVHVELALQPTYEGAVDYLRLLAWLRERGFEPADLVPFFRHEGLLIEADCLLVRTG